MKTIIPTELQRLLATQPDLVLLDVCTPVEHAGVHVLLARNLPLAELDPQTLIKSGTVPQSQPFYLICHSGARAAKAAQEFSQHGYTHAVVVEGGLRAWIDAGLPVNRGQVRAISLERQVRIAAGSLVLAGAGLGWLFHPGFFGLSVFVGAGLIFAGITDYCGLGLLLARAPWNKRVAQ